MAGAGYKLFNTGDVLTAAQVNEYLMQQTVMVFADAAARTTALSGIVAEGMMSYLKDTNKTYRYDGSAWLDDAGTTSPLTTKGDVWTYSTTDARLGVGANDTVLTADSSTTTGLKWATPNSGSMTLLSTTSLSGSTTTVSSISGSYQDLLILVYGVTWDTANTNLEWYTNLTSVATYSNLRSSLTTVGNTLLATNILINDGAEQVKRTGGLNTKTILIRQYASTNNYKAFSEQFIYEGENNNQGRTGNCFGSFASTTAINSFSLTNSGAYTFTAGTIKIWGIK